ncbi:MAG: hypothetical protein WDM76_00710 [Limisphaerales bacterium]
MSSVTNVQNKMKAEMNKLKIAPTSAASITLMPTASPASASRTQRVDNGVSGVFETTNAIAKKSMPMAICCEAMPQQAVAKKVEFNIVASAPSVAANGDSFNCRKNVHAPNPKMNKAMGARNFAMPTGPSSQHSAAVMLGGKDPPPKPISFKSFHIPVKAPGNCNHAALCGPKGPSLLKWTNPPRKLLQNSTAKITNNNMGVENLFRLTTGSG